MGRRLRRLELYRNATLFDRLIRHLTGGMCATNRAERRRLTITATRGEAARRVRHLGRTTI